MPKRFFLFIFLVFAGIGIKNRFVIGLCYPVSRFSYFFLALLTLSRAFLAPFSRFSLFFCVLSLFFALNHPFLCTLSLFLHFIAFSSLISCTLAHFLRSFLAFYHVLSRFLILFLFTKVIKEYLFMLRYG